MELGEAMSDHHVQLIESNGRYFYTCDICQRHVEWGYDKEGQFHITVEPKGDQAARHIAEGTSFFDTGLTMTAEAEPKEVLPPGFAEWEPKGGWKL
jgi:hypothetical protein